MPAPGNKYRWSGQLCECPRLRYLAIDPSSARFNAIFNFSTGVGVSA
jgi:hypothetical protein